MSKRDLLKIKNELRRMPIKKYNLLLSFLRWLNYSDEVLTDQEIAGISKSRKEKGGISWARLRQNV